MTRCPDCGATWCTAHECLRLALREAKTKIELLEQDLERERQRVGQLRLTNLSRRMQ